MLMVNQLIGFGAGGDSDPFFSSVSLLLHCEGADASTTFTDSSSFAHTVTVGGDAQVDTAQFKFGSASFLSDGTGDYATIANDSSFQFGTGDFTIEMFVRFNVAGANRPLLTMGNSNNAGQYWLLFSSNVLSFVTANVSRATGSWTPSTGVWYHVAVSRSGTSLRLFVDGTQVGSTGTSSDNINGTQAVYVGYEPTGARDFNGWIDEVRVTNGVGRYTANFTAPSAPFPNN